jgi:hypothetical protein
MDAVREALALDQRSFHPAEGGFQATSRLQELRGEFSSSGATFRDRRAAGGGWRFELSASELGGVALDEGVISATADRLVISRPGLDEFWADRGDDGFEHGFDVLGPTGAPGVGLVLETRGLDVSLGEDGLVLADPHGATRLSYGSLSAVDAAGRVLPAWFEAPDCTGDTCSIAVTVDDAEAVWPVRIDPMLTTLSVAQIASNAAPNRWYGESVAVSGDTVAVGAPGDPSLGLAGGSVYLLDRNGTGADSWAEARIIAAPAGALGFGASVALSGDLLVVGAPGSATSTGTAWLYARNQGGIGTWGLVSQLLPTVLLTAGDAFGASVALVPEIGIAVGAPGHAGGAGIGVLFYELGATWPQLTTLASAGSAGFGSSVAVDGQTLVFGAPGSGQAYVYELATDALVAILDPGIAGSEAGASVALDGQRVIVGAPGEGAARIYQRATPGFSWPLLATLGPGPGATGTRYGLSVAIEDNAVAVADTEDLWVHEENTWAIADAWAVSAEIPGELADGGPGQVALADHVLVSGHPLADSATGEAQIVRRTDDAWTGVRRPAIVPIINQLGQAVSIDGDWLAVGAPSDDSAGANAGSVFVFQRNKLGRQSWGLAATLRGTAGSLLGTSVSLDGSLLAAGGPGYGAGAGLVRTYEYGSGGWTQIDEQLGAGAAAAGTSVAVCLDRVLAGLPGLAKIWLIDPYGGSKQVAGTGAVAAFGTAVACDGTRGVVGAPSGLGQAFYLEYDSALGVAILATLTPDAPVIGSFYGASVAISGRTIAVGGPGDNSAGGLHSGGVQIFRETGVNTWTYEKEVALPAGAIGAGFGTAIALDGERLAVGSPKYNSARGEVTLFERDQLGADQWGAVAVLTDPAAAVGDELGASVDLEGGSLAAGIPFADGAAADAGSFWVWDADTEIPPVANADVAATTEEQAVVGNVLSNDFDGNGDALTASLVSGPSHGGASVLADGTFTYHPAVDFAGVDSFVYLASDAAGGTPGTVAITVANVNDPPVAANFAGQTQEDVPLNGAVVATDADGDPPTFALVTGDPGIALAPDGTLVVDPPQDFVGTLKGRFQAFDGHGGVSGTAEISVRLDPENDAPVALDDAYDTPEDVPVVGAASVIANDVDVDLDLLTVSLVSGPTSGTLTLRPDGTFDWTAATADFNGLVTFEYSVSDGLLADTGTVAITVDPVNDAPVAQDFVGQVKEDHILPGSFLVATDVDGTIPTWTIVEPSPDAVLQSIVSPFGVLTVGPAQDFVGVLTIKYTVTDDLGLESAPATITITVTAVDDAQVGVEDVYDLQEDEHLSTTALAGLLANDTDVEGDVLSVVSPALITAPNATLTVNADGSFELQPDLDFSGDIAFTYQASDSPLVFSALTPVVVHVAALNDPPAVQDFAAEIDEDTPLDGQLVGSDVDGTVASWSLVESSLPEGALSVDPATGSIHLAPVPDFVGVIAATYTATDDRGAVSLPGNIAITVDPVDDAPIAVDDPDYATPEGTPLATTVLDGLLANDVDVDSAPIEVFDPTSIVPSDPTVSLVVAADGTFVLDGGPDFNGVVTFSYLATDGAEISALPATVTVDVTPVDDPPTVADDFAETMEDTPIDIDVLANDSDVEGDPLSIVEVEQPANGTLEIVGDLLHWTPALDDDSPSVVGCTISDGTGVSVSELTLTVLPDDDRPVPLDDAFAGPEDLPIVGNVLSNDLDVDSVLTMGNVVPPAVGAFTSLADGSFTWTPPLDFVGVDAFTYYAMDEVFGIGPVTVTLTITGVDDPPNAVDDLANAVEEQMVDVDVVANDSDVEADPLSVVAVSAPAHGTIAIVANHVQWTPALDRTDPTSVTCTISDGTEVSESTLDLTVTPVNDLPIGTADLYFTNEDVDAFGNVLDNDTDVDSIPSVALYAPPAGGVLTLNADGSFVWTPPLDFSGNEFFYYQLLDGADVVGPIEVSLVVAPLDDPPTGVADAFDVDENGVLNENVLANDFDVEGDAMTAMQASNPAHGLVSSFEPDGSFSYAPDPGYVGDDSFTYQLSANGLLSPDVEVDITVNPVVDTGDTAAPPDTGGDADADTDTDSDSDTDTGNCTPTTWYEDNDSDGFGNTGRADTACVAPVGFVAEGGDCDDIDPSIHPGVSEVANDGVDQDCSKGDLRVVGDNGGCSCASERIDPTVLLAALAALVASRRRLPARRSAASAARAS